MSLLNSDDNDYSSKQTILVFSFSAKLYMQKLGLIKLTTLFSPLSSSSTRNSDLFQHLVDQCVYSCLRDEQLLWTLDRPSADFQSILHHHPLHWRSASWFVNFTGLPPSALQRHIQIPWLIRTDNIPDRCWEWDVNKHCDALFSEAWWCLTAPSPKTHGSFFS